MKIIAWGIIGVMATMFVFVLFPLIVANIFHQAVVVKSDFLHFLAIPIDGQSIFRGERLFGAHKTVRGIIVVAAITSIATYLISFTYTFPFLMHPALFGLLIGGAYMLAELPNSFLKRRLNIHEGARGKGWVGSCFAFFDHADSVLGAAIALFFLVHLDYATLAAFSVFGILLHHVIERLLHALGYRKVPAR